MKNFQVEVSQLDFVIHLQHVPGPPTYILGTPPVSTAPVGYSMATPMSTGLGMSPMYPGMMGGVHGMAMPQPSMMVMGPSHRRRLVVDDSMDIDIGYGLKKCALMMEDGVEICAIYDLMNGAMALEYNIAKTEDKDMMNEIITWNQQHAESGPDYLEQQKWIWSGKLEGDGGEQCNARLLSMIGYTICIKEPVDENGHFKRDSVYMEIMENVTDRRVKRLYFDRDDEWSAIYEMKQDELQRDDLWKWCRYIEGNDLCVEGSSDGPLVITVAHSNML